MSAAASYPMAAIPEPWQILGLRLKPFCLGHYWLMKRFGVAFVSSEDAGATFDDLVLGVLICSMSFEDFLKLIDQPDFHAKLKPWARAFALDQQTDAFDFAGKCALFQRYLDTAMKQPVVIFEQEDSPSGADWSQSLFLTLTGHLGYSSREARNLPFSQAFTDFYKHAENIGAVTIVDEMTAALLEAAAAEENIPTPADLLRPPDELWSLQTPTNPDAPVDPAALSNFLKTLEAPWRK